jgi:hypothetical protein
MRALRVASIESLSVADADPGRELAEEMEETRAFLLLDLRGGSGGRSTDGMQMLGKMEFVSVAGENLVSCASRLRSASLKVGLALRNSSLDSMRASCLWPVREDILLAFGRCVLSVRTRPTSSERRGPSRETGTWNCTFGLDAPIGALPLRLLDPSLFLEEATEDVLLLRLLSPSDFCTLGPSSCTPRLVIDERLLPH